MPFLASHPREDENEQPGCARHEASSDRLPHGVLVPSQRPDGFVMDPSDSVKPQPGMSRQRFRASSSGLA